MDLGRAGTGFRLEPGGGLIASVVTDRGEIAAATVVNSSSGHGVMHAPALGQLAAEKVLEGSARAMDVGAQRPTRVVEGQANLASDLL